MALIDRVKDKVKDDSGRLSDLADYAPAIEAALAGYSKHKPRTLVRDLSGTGGHDLALPAEWDPEFSSILRVEYPAGRVPAALIPADEWALYQDPAGEMLRLPYCTPNATETVRVAFTAIREEAEVPTGDLDAVANLAAAACCETLANIFAQTSDPTIAADVVNYRSKSSEFAARAKRLRDLYGDHLGIDADGGAPAASVTAPAPEDGRIRLTH